MKIFLFVSFVVVLVACGKDDNNPVSPYPVAYGFDHIDQTNEGLYVVTADNSLSGLPTSTGLFGQYKDSLKTELQKVIASNLDLQEIELTSETELRFHYIYQGHSVMTPATYTIVNGDIIIADSLFNDIVSYDKVADQFNLCGVTAFALPGPNAIFPLGPPYFQFNVETCIDGHANRDYAMDLLISKNLKPMDTIGVLVTKYIYTK
ncbi:MAG: hypothetical protein IPP15_04845 [Saprospiraceae bacterium]|uniref:Uncharacterized protein n=1 Tax=Candidatus Opimibacter skivensis TaxID=2982028 RepID=A0A9D7SU15_9BACT|nr:hypothetical protein [Candidatus Opimibacter skivensis]